MKRECPKCHTLNNEDANFCSCCGNNLSTSENARKIKTKYFENTSFENVKKWLNKKRNIEITEVKTNIFCQGASGLFLSKHNWIINQMEITYYCDNPNHVQYDMVWGFGYDALLNIHDGMVSAENTAHQQASNKKIVYEYSRKAPCPNYNGYKDNCCLLIIEDWRKA